MKRNALILSCVVAAAFFLPLATPLFADSLIQPESSQFRLQLHPDVSVPLGDSGDVFALGGGGSLLGEYAFGGSPLSIRLGVGYGYLPTVGTPTVSLFSGLGGVGFCVPLASFLGLDLNVDVGYNYAAYNKSSDGDGYGNALVQGGVGLRFLVTPNLTLDLGGTLVYQMGLYLGVGAQAGVTVGFGGQAAAPAAKESKPKTKPEPLQNAPVKTVPQPGAELEIGSVDFSTVFPVFFKYYDDHPIGTITLVNSSNAAVSDVRVSIFIKDYMNAAQELPPVASMAKGESRTLDMSALFSDQILTVTERTKVQAQITVRYTAAKLLKELTKVESVSVVDRNGMTWDDDRKAAPFVTPKDTPVMGFAKNVAGSIKGKGNPVLNANLSLAVAMHEALATYGLAYVVDPKSSYSDFSAKKTEIDYLQFPRQTLAFKAGDCDDLTILNCSLLESVGVETAFVTVPGHIFMAVSLGLTPDEARQQFARVDDLILEGEQAWIPVEVTQITGGFLKAWNAGAQEWREYKARNQARLYPLQEAWKLYQPVFFKGEDVQVSVPPSDKFLPAFMREQTAYIDQEISTQVARLQADVQKNKSSPKSVNKLGILYARYGLYDRAQKQFQQATQKAEYGPALANLGNIAYAQGRLDEANTFYQRAYKVSPNNPSVLLGLARVNQDQENYGAVKTYYAKLNEVDAQLAQQYSYLGLKGEEATRAADISGAKERQAWAE